VKIDVKKVAKLANLPLSTGEEKKLEAQLEETLAYIDNLNEVDTDKVETTNQVTGLENVSREDKARPSLTQEQALSNTKSTHNSLFKVDAILED
jgi:aspartyl-tRNA(Asn)/glutamyl-tRNA(Gln) amidotransferase subunit C